MLEPFGDGSTSRGTAEQASRLAGDRDGATGAPGRSDSARPTASTASFPAAKASARSSRQRYG
jgi:hypothetical protein